MNNEAQTTEDLIGQNAIFNGVNALLKNDIAQLIGTVAELKVINQAFSEEIKHLREALSEKE